jgi:hypothetical protein
VVSFRRADQQPAEYAVEIYSTEGCQGSRRKINAFVSSPDWFRYLLHMSTNGSRMLVASKKHNFSELSSAQGFSRENPGEIREKSRIARGLCGF